MANKALGNRMGNQKTVLISLLLVVTLASYADSQFSKLVDLFRGGSSDLDNVEPQGVDNNIAAAPEVNKSLSLGLSKELDVGLTKGLAQDNASGNGNEIQFGAPPQTTPRPVTYYTPSPKFQQQSAPLAPVEMRPETRPVQQGPPVYPHRPTARPYHHSDRDRYETHQERPQGGPQRQGHDC